MKNAKAAETGEVPHMDRKDLRNIMEIHARSDRSPNRPRADAWAVIVDVRAFAVMHCLGRRPVSRAQPEPQGSFRGGLS